jgi:outer membrane protein assembly factor BamB
VTRIFRSPIAEIVLASVLGLHVLTACSARAEERATASAVRNPTWTTYQRLANHNAVVPGALSATWSAELGQRSNGALAVVGDTVYVTTFARTVLAIAVDTGQTRWQYQADDIVMSSPVVADGLVIVGTGTDRRLSPTLWGRPEGNAVIALDAATGRERWRFRTAGEDMPSPAIQNGTLVFANGDAHAYGLDLLTGRHLWTTPLSGVSTMASATPSGGDVIVSSCTLKMKPGQIAALRVRDGSPHWRAPYGNCDSAPAVDAGRVFVSGMDFVRVPYGLAYEATVASLDAETGAVRWSYRTPDVGLSSMVVSSERAVAGTLVGDTYYQALPTHDRILAFDANSGAVRWSVKTLAPAKMSPIVANGRLYVGDTVGCLYTIDARSGKILNVRTFKAPFSTSPPVIVGETMLVVVGTTLQAMPLPGAPP